MSKSSENPEAAPAGEATAAAAPLNVNKYTWTIRRRSPPTRTSAA